MENMHFYLQFGLSVLGVIGGLLAYVLGLRIKHDILENNEKIEKQFSDLREKQHAAINSLRDELIRELGSAISKHSEKIDRTDRDVSDLTASMTDKILSVVNGKYVRTDLHQQTIAGIQERFTSMKELIEVNMDKIEQGLDRQILDLKDRIFHGK